MTLTLKEFQAFVDERMREAMVNPELLQAKFKEIMDFGFANEAMDADAKDYFDKLQEFLANMIETGLRDVPDSPGGGKIGLYEPKHPSPLKL
jgi:hypothetical protein